MELSEPPFNPLPVKSLDAASFWAACDEHRLVMQRCTSCGLLQFYPRALCRHCGGVDLVDEQVSGDGRVASFTICHRAVGERFMDRVPYVLALIDLDEGPRLMSNIVDCPPEEVAIGDRVQVAFEQAAPDVILPVFTRITGS
jgi:uncharacterized OB-fold protein